MAAVQQAGTAQSAMDARPHTPLNQLNEGIGGGLRSPPGSGVEGYFNPPKLTRTNSIYSLSRASFTHQLSQLTSLSLPDSASLSSTVAAIPTAPAATTALRNAATQIQKWIQKANEVLGGLDADDDVEWAAAGGRDGLEDVDGSIVKFQRLVNAYVGAIEDLQKRRDIGDVPKKDFNGALDTLDQVVVSWENVSKLLKEVKSQVELALEWEELWNSVLGEIRLEIENLSKFIFEMEEKRHQAKAEGSPADMSPNLDMSELETIVEEDGPLQNGSSNTPRRPFGLPPQLFGDSPLQSPDIEGVNLDHTGLMELFARMEPLKASLDFLPMRLSGYRHRAEPILPTACDELDAQRKHLEKRFTALQKEAEKVQQELGEDKWVATFRNVGRQAQKMCVTVERGIVRMHEAFESANVSNPNSAAVAKKIGEYKEKKNYYGPAIQKILSIIDGGVKRLTTKNGEVLAISTDTKNAWHKLEAKIKEADSALQSYTALRSPGGSHMRDSTSSIISHDYSTTESAVDTPGSSPASSVILAPSSTKPAAKTTAPHTPEVGSTNSRRNSLRSSSGSRPPTQRRSLAVTNPPSASSLSKRLSYVPSISRLQSQSPSPSSRAASRQGSSTPTPSTPHHPPGKPVPIAQRPKWNAGTRVDYKAFEAASHLRPLPLANGNPNTRSLNGQTLRPSGRTSRTASATLPHPSPLWRESSASPAPGMGRRTLPSRPASVAAHGRSVPSPAPARMAPRSTPGGARSGAMSSARGATGSTARASATGAARTPAKGPSAAVKAHERLYTPTTPKAAPTPPPARQGSASHRPSLLPISSSYGIPTIQSPTDSEFAAGAPDSPSPLAGRPATALGMMGGAEGTERSRRSSLLPMPRLKP